MMLHSILQQNLETVDQHHRIVIGMVNRRRLLVQAHQPSHGQHGTTDTVFDRKHNILWDLDELAQERQVRGVARDDLWTIPRSTGQELRGDKGHDAWDRDGVVHGRMEWEAEVAHELGQDFVAAALCHWLLHKVADG